MLNQENKEEKWSEQFVRGIEKKFENAFQEIYEHHFIEDIFEEYKSTVTKVDYINAIEEMNFQEKL